MPTIGNQVTQQAFVTDQFSGNGSTVAFTMSVSPATTTSVLVAVSGVLQDPSTYAVSGTTLTFSAAPPTGTGNISCRYMGIPASGVTTTAYRTVTDFTATAGQTSFSVPSYTVGYIDVYRNGSKLGTADFTATTGTTVVLASGAAAGDLIETVSFYVSSVLNAIPNTAGSVSQSNLAANVAGNGPSFSYYQSVSQTGIATGTETKVTFTSQEFDTTGGMYSSSRFTPSIAGYYKINACVYLSGSIGATLTEIRKNGSVYKFGNYHSVTTNTTEAGTLVSSLVYCNGSTDYIEIYVFYYGTGTASTNATQPRTWFNGCLVRSA